MSEATPQPLLRFLNVSRYFGGVRALDDVSLSVPSGRVTAIIGPNGSGKTTLFNVAMGMFPASAGKVWVNGLCTSGWPMNRVAQLGVARTFQEVRLFRRFTVAENLVYALRRGQGERLVDALLLRRNRTRWSRLRAQALELLSAAGLEDRADAPASAISYGQAKLLELLRAMATEPRLLLLDEPAGGLSPSAIAHVIAMVRRAVTGGTTVVLIEHNLPLVSQIADGVIVLDAGRKIAEGTPDVIRDDDRVREAYFG